MSQLPQFMQTHTPQIQQALKNFLAEQHKLAPELTPHWAESIDTITDFVMRGGKAIRPLLVVLSYQLFGGKEDAVYAVAAGVEMLHKYLLNMDDIADRDEKRYGGPTIWQFYQLKYQDWQDKEHHGRTLAEVDGVLMASFATELVRTANFPANKILDVLGIMNQRSYWKTIAGWKIQYFMNHTALPDATEEEFLKGLELVTGQYSFVAPLKIGALLAGVKESSTEMKALEEYGHHIGRAFQLHDDVLGLFGEPEETGKPVGNDVREGKKTLLLQRAYKKSNKADQKFLTDVCGRNLTASELKRVQEIVKETGALAESEKLAKESVEKGIAALAVLDQQKNEVELLKELANFVIERKK